MKSIDDREIINFLEFQKIIYLYQSYLNMFTIASMLEHARNFLDQQGGVIFGAVSLDGPKNKAKNFIVKIDAKYANMIYDVKGIETYKGKDYIYFLVPFLKTSIKDFISFWNYNVLSKFADNSKDTRVIKIDFYGTNVAEIRGSFSTMILYNEKDFLKRGTEKKVKEFVKSTTESFIASMYGLPIPVKKGEKHKRNRGKLVPFFYEKLSKYYLRVLSNQCILPTIESLGFSYVFSKDNEILQKSLNEIFVEAYSLGHYIRVPLFYNLVFENLNPMLSIVKDKIEAAIRSSKKETGEILNEVLENFIYTLIFSFESIISTEDLDRILSSDEISISFLNTLPMPVDQIDHVKSVREQIRILMLRSAELIRSSVGADDLRLFIENMRDKRYCENAKEKLVNNFSYLFKDYSRAIKKPPFDFFAERQKDVNHEILEAILFILINTKDCNELSEILLGNGTSSELTYRQ